MLLIELFYEFICTPCCNFFSSVKDYKQSHMTWELVLKNGQKTNSPSRALPPFSSPPTVQDHVTLVNDRHSVHCETLCGTSNHGGLWTTSPQEWLLLGGPGPRASSPVWPLTRPVCARWPQRDGGGDFSPAKQRVVIDVAETSVLIFCSLTASL